MDVFVLLAMVSPLILMIWCDYKTTQQVLALLEELSTEYRNERTKAMEDAERKPGDAV